MKLRSAIVLAGALAVGCGEEKRQSSPVVVEQAAASASQKTQQNIRNILVVPPKDRIRELSALGDQYLWEGQLSAKHDDWCYSMFAFTRALDALERIIDDLQNRKPEGLSPDEARKIAMALYKYGEKHQDISEERSELFSKLQGSDIARAKDGILAARQEARRLMNNHLDPLCPPLPKNSQPMMVAPKRNYSPFCGNGVLEKNPHRKPEECDDARVIPEQENS